MQNQKKKLAFAAYESFEKELEETIQPLLNKQLSVEQEWRRLLNEETEIEQDYQGVHQEHEAIIRDLQTTSGSKENESRLVTQCGIA